MLAIRCCTWFPSSGLDNAEVQPYVVAGSHPNLVRLDMPETISELVEKCFSVDASARPDFGTITETLAAEMLQRGRASRPSQIARDNASSDDLYAVAPVAHVPPEQESLYEVPESQRDTTSAKNMVLEHDKQSGTTLPAEEVEEDYGVLSNDTAAAAESNAFQSGTMVMPSSVNPGEKFELYNDFDTIFNPSFFRSNPLTPLLQCRIMRSASRCSIYSC